MRDAGWDDGPNQNTWRELQRKHTVWREQKMKQKEELEVNQSNAKKCGVEERQKGKYTVRRISTEYQC